MTCVKPSKKEKVLLSQRIKADCLERQVETEIMDSVMGPAVYDSRIRPSGINGTGRTTAFSFYPQQSPVKRKWSVAPSIEWVNSKPRHISDGATFVYVNVFVRSFSAINDVKMVSSGLLISQPSISHHSPGCSFILSQKYKNVDFFHFHAVLSTAFNPYSQSSQTCWKLDRKFHF